MHHLWLLVIPTAIMVTVNADTRVNQMVNDGSAHNKEKDGMSKTTKHFETTELPRSSEPPKSTGPPPPCRGTYDYTEEGKQYKFFNFTRLWDNASASCRLDGARLMHILSYDDYICITLYRASVNAITEELWIGLVNTATDMFEWEDGPNFTVDPETGVPVDKSVFTMFEGRTSHDTTIAAGNRRCMHSADHDEMYLWQDYNCDTTERKFICECPQ